MVRRPSPDEPRHAEQLRGVGRGASLPKGVEHLRDFLAQRQLADAVRLPLIMRAWLHAGLEGEQPLVALLPRARVLVEKCRGHEKGWILEPHGGWLEVSEEIPEQGVVHQTAYPDPEMDPQIEGVGAQSC